MFGSVVSSLVDTFEGVDDAGVVAAIGVAAGARRAPEDDTERACWAIDGHESIVAEISAELRISRGRARGQLRYANLAGVDEPYVKTIFGRATECSSRDQVPSRAPFARAG
jgi:Domain of unknown function (DUF222)